MKKLILSLLMLNLAACAGGSGGSSPSPAPQDPPTTISYAELAGRWQNEMYDGETMDISNTGEMTDSICGYQASFTEPDLETGAFVLTIRNTNGTPGCMSNTDHLCEMELAGSTLAIACDNRAHIYLFSK